MWYFRSSILRPHRCRGDIAFWWPTCVFKCALKLPASDDAKSHWLHLFIFLHCMFWMLSHIVWTKWSIITHVAWLHVETVCLQNVALLSQNLVRNNNFPHQSQLKCVKTAFLLNVKWCIFKYALKFPSKEDAKLQWFGMAPWCQKKHVTKGCHLKLYFRGEREWLLRVREREQE